MTTDRKPTPEPDQGANSPNCGEIRGRAEALLASHARSSWVDLGKVDLARDVIALADQVEELRSALEYERSRVSDAYGAPWPEHQRTIDAAREVCPEAVRLLESRIAYLLERFHGHQRIIGNYQRGWFRDLARIRRNVRRAWTARASLRSLESALPTVSGAPTEEQT